MSKEFATRNLVHNKIPEFPSGSGADRFLTKKEILDTSPFARIDGSYSDVAIPIMDNVIYAEAAFSVSRTSFQLPQNTGSESFTVTSTIGGEALAWSVSEFNASWATYSVSGNSVSVHANADQTTESQKSGYIRVKQSVTNQEITVNFTQAAGVPTYTYTFSPSTTSLSFGATANSQSISVTSYRTKYINGHQVGTENLDYSSSSPRGGLTVSGTTFSVTENVVESSRSWSVVFTQSVSGNTFTVSVTQAAVSITWGHEFTSATTSLSFIATGETKRIAVNSIRRKYINGNPTTEVAAVPYTPSISGDSTFSVSSYDTSEIYIVAANNLTVLQRTGTLTLSQQSSGKTLSISLSQEAVSIIRLYIMFDGVQGGSPIIKWFTANASDRISENIWTFIDAPLGTELILEPQCEDCEIHFEDDYSQIPIGVDGNYSSSTDFENYRYTNRDGKVTGRIRLGYDMVEEMVLTIY